MLQKATVILAFLFALTFINCSKENNISISNNSTFNAKYKSTQKVSPIGNIVSTMQSNSLIQNNYEHYAKKHDTAKHRYKENREYMLFLADNDIKNIKNITVESMPSHNLRHIAMKDAKNSIYDVNKVPYLKIEYIMFINKVLTEEHQQERDGDPIMHPLVYDKVPRTDRHIVMGDEYHKWHSWCEVNGVC